MGKGKDHLKESLQWVYKPLLLDWWPSPTILKLWEFRRRCLRTMSMSHETCPFHWWGGHDLTMWNQTCKTIQKKTSRKPLGPTNGSLDPNKNGKHVFLLPSESMFLLSNCCNPSGRRRQKLCRPCPGDKKREISARKPKSSQVCSLLFQWKKHIKTHLDADAFCSWTHSWKMHFPSMWKISLKKSIRKAIRWPFPKGTRWNHPSGCKPRRTWWLNQPLEKCLSR